MPKAPAPLEGLLVADFSRILAGPLCTMLLADAGARVIKVEEPGRGDETRRWGPPFIAGESAYFLSVNRNKESLTLNLKSARGRQAARRLIERADVVVENFRPEQRRRLGLSPSTVARMNRRAVLCSIRGFEPDSAEADLPGYDLLAQASAGLMWITGEPDGPPMKIGVALADVLTAHYALEAILAGLYARERNGRGTHVEISIFGATVASLINVAQSHLVTRKEAKRYGNAHPSIVPYQAFQASDRMFVVAAATDRHFALLCANVLGRDDLGRDRRFRTNAARVRNRTRLSSELQRLFKRRTAAAWVRTCRREGIPAAVVAGLREVFRNHPALIGATDHTTAGTIPLVRHPVRFGSSRFAIRAAPPLLGEHTEAVLSELGYDAREIASLRRLGAV